MAREQSRRALHTRDLIVSMLAQAEMVRKSVEEGVELDRDDISRLIKAEDAIGGVLRRSR